MIHAAAQNGYLPFLKKIRPGRKFAALLPLIDKPNDDGITPLHLAAEGGYADACVCLLDLGASPLLPHPISRLTPLQIAALEGLDQVVEYALDHHVPASVAALVHKSLMSTAIEANSEELVRSLLERGSDSGTGIDASALLTACEHGKRGIVQMLLDFNANPNACEQVVRAANLSSRLVSSRLVFLQAACCSFHSMALSRCTPPPTWATERWSSCCLQRRPTRWCAIRSRTARRADTLSSMAILLSQPCCVRLSSKRSSSARWLRSRTAHHESSRCLCKRVPTLLLARSLSLSLSLCLSRCHYLLYSSFH